FTFQKAFPNYWAAEELRTYRVELLRPPVDDIRSDDSHSGDAASMEQGLEPIAEKGQATISLDTKDERYVDFFKIIKARIQDHWRYPQGAKKNLIEGRLLVLFSLSRDGNLIQIKITKASGHEILDQEAVRAIRSAAPFPPFPRRISLSRLNIKASIDYRLKAKKYRDNS
ncbi:energy transducer TonB, partial [Thermodesulfobacteriota bacterium]